MTFIELSANIALGLFALMVILLVAFRYLKNYYYFPFHEDELFKEMNDAGTKNLVYSTYGETRKYIRRYVLRKSRYDKAVICNYNEQYKNISFYIMVYTKKHRCIQVISVSEKDTSNSSKIILVSNRCSYVNVIIKEADDVCLNTNAIKPISLNRIRFYSLFSSFAFTCFMYSATYYVLKLISGKYFELFVKSTLYYIILGAIAIISILYFILTYLRFKHVNCHGKNGGALEYEFF